MAGREGILRDVLQWLAVGAFLRTFCSGWQWGILEELLQRPAVKASLGTSCSGWQWESF
jgi:hypothetical protein